MIIAALAAGGGVYYLFREPHPERGREPENKPDKAESGEITRIQRGTEIRILPYDHQEEAKPATELEQLDKKKAPDPKRQIKEGDLKKKNKLKLSYDTDEIITKNSRYSFHRRPLLNAELLVEKENYESALEILTRTENRIPDQEIKRKIGKNAEDIRNFLNEPDEEDLTLEDGKYSKVEIPFHDLVRAIKEITEGLSHTVDKGLSYPPIFPEGAGRNAPESALGGIGNELKDIRKETISGEYKIVAVPMILDESVLQKLEDLGNVPKEPLFDPGKFFPQNSPPVIYQIFQNSGGGSGVGASYEPLSKQLGSEETKSTTDVKGGEEGRSDSGLNRKEPYTPGEGTSEKGFAGGGGPGASGGFPGYSASESMQVDPYAESRLEALLEKESKAKEKSDGVLESALFDANWGKFQNLPIKDRRSGIERRKTNERRGDFLRKDRRSGEDRRKNDLFKEREEFLDKKAEEKKEDDLHNLLNKKISDVVPPVSFPAPFQPGYVPFEKLPILLPDPEEKEINARPSVFSLPDPVVKDEIEIGDLNLPDPLEKQFLPEPQAINNELDLLDVATEYKPSLEQLKLASIDLPVPQDILLKPEALELPQENPIVSEKEKEVEKPVSELESTKPDIQDELVEEKVDDSFIKISLPDPVDLAKEPEKEIEASPLPQIPATDQESEFPEVEVVEGNLDELEPPPEAEPKEVTPPEPERTIHGILELKPPEADDAPFLTLTYDFGKIPHSFRLSKNHTVMEYSYYKYKPMLMKAQEFARRKMLKNALNYYRVIKSQNIPPELKRMVNRNITDITEFMEKYLMAKG